MEMESVHLDHGGPCMEETSDKQLFPPGSPDSSDIFGDPQMNTRVGDDYQAEIPSLMTKSKRLQLLTNPADSGVVFDISLSFLMGLPIPITWVQEEDEMETESQGFASNHDESVNLNGVAELKSRTKIHIKLKKKGSAINLEPLAAGLDCEKELRAANGGNIAAGKTSLDGLQTSKRYCPVPGSKCEHWSEADVKSFVLGLYIFGKNFVSIKRFIENKEMGEILSFYYGEFYRSGHYRRWSDSRKVRSRKCITGRKIFTGWRLQELVSRLVPHIPEEFQSSLLEGSRSFLEGRISLEEYVASLKSSVGIQILVEAFGIGKGKDDLTSLSMEPGKTNPTFQVCPNLPTGKACSSLTPSDILNFLTGGFRLSKARCNDIFWEAVWPRLLARGWHSEQPNNQGYVSSKHYLVFLMPGVKKFSRRKLVKGDHYFDSVSDVLSKVASEPKLLELEAEGATLQNCNENGWVPEVTSDTEDLSDHQRHCYLKPRVTACNPNLMRFTVVDTSSVHGGKSSNVRELRYLPGESTITSNLSNCLKGNEGKLFKNSQDDCKVYASDMPMSIESNTNKVHNNKGLFDTSGPKGMKFTVVDTSLRHGEKSSEVRETRYFPVEIKSISKLTSFQRDTEGTSSEDSLDRHGLDAADMLVDREKNIISDSDDTNQKEIITNADTTSNKTMESHQDEMATVSDDRQLKTTIKLQFSRRVKSGHSNYVAPVSKRRKLTVCSKAKRKCFVENFSEGLESKEAKLLLALNSTDGGKNVSSQTGHQEKVSVISSSKGSPDEESGGGMLSESSSSMDLSDGENEKHKGPPSLDLNLPQVPLKSEETGDMLIIEVGSGRGIDADDSYSPSKATEPVPNALRTSVEEGTTEEQPNMNTRRQSKRSRPPTIRALEALANGFLSVQKRQKNAEVHARENTFSSPSRKARSRMKVMSSRGSTSTKTIEVEENGMNEAHNADKDMVDKPLDPIEKEAHQLLGISNATYCPKALEDNLVRHVSLL